MNISVPERGSTEVESEAWLALSRSDEFWRLQKANIISATALPGGRARINGGSMVGRAKFGDVVLDVHEKIPGALRALLGVTNPSFRTERVSAPATDLGDLISMIVKVYLADVRTYVGEGRRWQYEATRMISSLVGGRLNVPTTVRLHARGLRHLAAFDKDQITYSTELNKLTLAGLREIETIAALVTISDEDVSSARAMALFFEDIRDVEVLFGSRIGLAARVVEYLDLAYDLPWEQRQLLSVAGVLLSHASFEVEDSAGGQVPLTWFLNLENLFEVAVRSMLQDIVTDSIAVSKGSSFGIGIFDLPGAEPVNPDLVVETSGRIVVGDVKYKSWHADASVSDLYQLLVHTKSLGSDECFLVYPGEAFEAIDLGTSSTGARVWLFCVDVFQLEASLKQLCQHLTLPLDQTSFSVSQMSQADAMHIL